MSEQAAIIHHQDNNIPAGTSSKQTSIHVSLAMVDFSHFCHRDLLVLALRHPTLGEVTCKHCTRTDISPLQLQDGKSEKRSTTYLTDHTIWTSVYNPNHPKPDPGALVEDIAYPPSSRPMLCERCKSKWVKSCDMQPCSMFRGN